MQCLKFYVTSSVVPLLQDQRLIHQVMIASHTLHGITQSIHLCKVMICSSQAPPFPFLKVTHFTCSWSQVEQKVQLHHIQYITQYIHIQKGVEFSIVPFLQGHGVYVYPIYKDIWTWSVPLIMIVYRIYAYMVSFLGQQTSLQPFYNTR